MTSCLPEKTNSTTPIFDKLLEDIEKFRKKIIEKKDEIRRFPVYFGSIPELRQVLVVPYFIHGNELSPDVEKVSIDIKFNFVGEPYFVFTWADVDPFGKRIS